MFLKPEEYMACNLCKFNCGQTEKCQGLFEVCDAFLGDSL